MTIYWYGNEQDIAWDVGHHIETLKSEGYDIQIVSPKQIGRLIEETTKSDFIVVHCLYPKVVDRARPYVDLLKGLRDTIGGLGITIITIAETSEVREAIKEFSDHVLMLGNVRPDTIRPLLEKSRKK